MNRKLAAIDYDGTTVNTKPVREAFFFHLCEKYGKPCPAEVLMDVNGKNIPFKVEYELMGFEWKKDKELIWNEFVDYFKRNPVKIFRGIKENLIALKRRDLKLALVTMNTRDLVLDTIKREGLENVLDLVLTMEDGDKKEKLLLKSARRFKLKPEECISIGDLKNDVYAAKAAGFLPLVAGYGGLAYRSIVRPLVPPKQYIARPENLARIVLKNL
jgi:phosphoglycolate phosphatase-like HAD superfamily hydrolase